jgi:hypothetical protein
VRLLSWLRITAVAVREDQVLMAGSAGMYENEKTQTPSRIYRPLQERFGGGERDGFFAILRRSK